MLNINKENVNKILKNKSVLKKTSAFVLAAGLIAVTMSGCGNKDLFDSNKVFDFAIISAEDRESALIVGIDKYTTYQGEQEQLILDDGSVLLVSSLNAKLFRNEGDFSAMEHALAYITDEGEITQISKINDKKINKDWLDFNYSFEKAIILDGNTAIIYDINQWTDYEEDDTIQIKLEDGSYILTGISNVVLMHEGDKYNAEDVAHGILGTDAVIKQYDTKKGYKVLGKK